MEKRNLTKGGKGRACGTTIKKINKNARLTIGSIASTYSFANLQVYFTKRASIPST
jgi:hypothetical protein